MGNLLFCTPTGITPITGFIFYPGGHVDYRSYAPIAREIASRGYLVSIVEMPLSLAVFGVNKANEVMSSLPGHAILGHRRSFPRRDRWRPSYAGKNLDNVQGLPSGHRILPAVTTFHH